MAKRHKFFISWMVFLSIGLSSLAEAQTAQWQQLVAAAKKEGKVVVSIPAGAELRKSLKEVFEKRYGIELELFTGRGTAIAKKIADEFRAGLRLTDVHTGGSGPIIFGLSGMLEPVEGQFILPEVREAKNWWGGHMYVDKTNRYGYSFLAFVQDAIWYNSDLHETGRVTLARRSFASQVARQDRLQRSAARRCWTR